MEKRAAFVLLGMLYLAGTFVTIQAVTYSGAAVVRPGQAWSIECTGLKPDSFLRWTRNGQSLEPELSSGELVVINSQRENGISKLTATSAKDTHEGDYKCTPESDDGFHLNIYVDLKIKVLGKTEAPLVLDCENRTAGEKITWKKDSVPLHTAFANHEDLIKLDNETGTLTLLKDNDLSYGNYSCIVSNTSTEYRIVPIPEAFMAESIGVVEGEKLQVTCHGRQYPGIKVMWEFNKENYTSSRGRVKLTADPERNVYGSVIIVENIQMVDRGDIWCRVSYNWSDETAGHVSKAKIMLRVKDKLAALWPFLGICAEVVVLCAIILIYEKKRNKAELEESDTDQSPETKPASNKDSDVRQRK